MNYDTHRCSSYIAYKASVTWTGVTVAAVITPAYYCNYFSYCRPPSRHCWIAGRRHACLGGSIQSHKNKDSLYGRKSLESGRMRQIVYKYKASPTVRSIDFIISMHHSKRSIPQVDRHQWSLRGFRFNSGDPVQLLEILNRRLRIRGQVPTFLWI
jgi:hypothetical protein